MATKSVYAVALGMICSHLVVLASGDCTNNCTTGYTCEVYEPTNETYCQPSCDPVDNGGCPAHRKCTLEEVQCIRAPCPPVIQCVDPCSEFHCPEGYVCDYYEDFNKTYCDPTCDGGSYTCPDDKVCVAVSYLPCYYPPCVYIECHYHEPETCVEQTCSGGNSRCLNITEQAKAFCLESCFVDGGGCGSKEFCAVEYDGESLGGCTAPPCSSVSCLHHADVNRCSPGKQYTDCGGCPTTCFNYQESLACAAVCVPGCFCPRGLVEFRDRCVDPLECHVLLNDPPPYDPLPHEEGIAVIKFIVDGLERKEYLVNQSTMFMNSVWTMLRDGDYIALKVKFYDALNDDSGRLMIFMEFSKLEDSASDLAAFLREKISSLSLPVSEIEVVTSPPLPDGLADEVIAIVVVVALLVGTVVTCILIAGIVLAVRKRKTESKAEAKEKSDKEPIAIEED